MDFAALYAAELRAHEAAIKQQAFAASQPSLPSALPALAPVGPEGLGLFYANAFLSRAEAASLTAVIDAFPASAWATLTKRRLLNLGGVPHPSGSWAEALPLPLVSAVAPRLAALGVFPAAAPFDQILLNEYRSGAGIGGHKDGPLFFPKVAIVSLGGDALLHFSRAGPEGPPCVTVLLRAGSLVVFEGAAYKDMFHYITDAHKEAVDGAVCANTAAAGAAAGDVVERAPRRLSLTLRRLANVERAFSEFEVDTPDVEDERQRRRRWWLASISEK